MAFYVIYVVMWLNWQSWKKWSCNFSYSMNQIHTECEFRAKSDHERIALTILGNKVLNGLLVLKEC